MNIKHSMLLLGIVILTGCSTTSQTISYRRKPKHMMPPPVVKLDEFIIEGKHEGIIWFLLGKQNDPDIILAAAPNELNSPDDKTLPKQIEDFTNFADEHEFEPIIDKTAMMVIWRISPDKLLKARKLITKQIKRKPERWSSLGFNLE